MYRNTDSFHHHRVGARRIVPYLAALVFVFVTISPTSSGQITGPSIDEREPNNTVASAQPIPVPIVVHGALNGADAGQILISPFDDLDDLFRLDLPQPAKITASLGFGGGGTGGFIPGVGPVSLTADLDLYLIGLRPLRLVDASLLPGETPEMIPSQSDITSGGPLPAGSYLMGITDFSEEAILAAGGEVDETTDSRYLLRIGALDPANNPIQVEAPSPFAPVAPIQLQFTRQRLSVPGDYGYPIRLEDVYAFSLDSPRPLKFEALAGSNTSDVPVYLLQNRGGRIEIVDGSLEGVIGPTLVPAGDYLVGISRTNLRARPNQMLYSLAIVEGNDPTGTRLAAGVIRLNRDDDPRLRRGF